MNQYNYKLFDRFRTKFNDDQIVQRYILIKIDYDCNTYSLRNVSTDQVTLETRENLYIYYIKENNY